MRGWVTSTAGPFFGRGLQLFSNENVAKLGRVVYSNSRSVGLVSVKIGAVHSDTFPASESNIAKGRLGFIPLFRRRSFSFTPMKKSRRGFASLSPDKLREVASKGGKMAHASGHAHQWASEEARAAVRKGIQSRYGLPR